MSDDDIYSAVRPMYYASKLLGLAPTSWYQRKQGFQCAKSWFLTQSWTVLMMVGLLIHLYYVTTFYSDGLNSREIIISYVYEVPMHVSCSVCLFTELIVNRMKMQRLLREISAADRMLVEHGNVSCSYVKIKRCYLLQLILVPLIVAFLLMYSFCDTDGYCDYIGFLPLVLNGVVTIQFLNFVLMLKRKYELVNDSLVSLFNMTNKLEDQPSLSDVPHITFIEKYVAEMQPSKSALDRGPQSVRQLRLIFSQLYGISLLINSTYGVHMLSVVTGLLACIVAYVTFVISTFLKETSQQFEIGALVVMCLVFFIMLAAIMIPCHVTADVASRSSVLVQKILVRESIEDDVRRDLDRLFVQLKCMDTTFTARGVFHLDMSMLCTALGLICTYATVISQIK